MNRAAVTVLLCLAGFGLAGCSNTMRGYLEKETPNQALNTRQDLAMPPDLRLRYRDTVYASLPTGCQGLLITLEYPQAEKAGPPFSVEQPEVEALFATPWRQELLERRDILDQEPRFREEGLSALVTAVYHLTNGHL